MTTRDFLRIYERNHVAFLKNLLRTNRRLQKYVGRLAHVGLADLKRLQVIEWFHTATLCPLCVSGRLGTVRRQKYRCTHQEVSQAFTRPVYSNE
ncbi:MAG: hypothetical protein KF722_03570 [Nitrospira sp.]|nr:hypothetical protein [Nitrospira sp.]